MVDDELVDELVDELLTVLFDEELVIFEEFPLLLEFVVLSAPPLRNMISILSITNPILIPERVSLPQKHN